MEPAKEEKLRGVVGLGRTSRSGEGIVVVGKIGWVDCGGEWSWLRGGCDCRVWGSWEG